MRPLGRALIQPDWCPQKKRKFGQRERYHGCTCTEERPRKDTGRRWPSTSQGKRPWKKTKP